MNIKNPYGNIVLVTGATSGIGRSVAQLLCENGFHVYGTARHVQNFSPMESGHYGGFIKLLTMDVRDQDSVDEVVRAVIKTEGRLDIVVNAAGMGIAGAVEDTTAEEAAQQMDTNFLGALRVMRSVLPQMRSQGGGLIVNISSVAGWVSVPFQSMYSASKYALEAMTQAVRVEAGPFGVRATLIEPGDTRTGFTKARCFTKETCTNKAYRTMCERALYSMTLSEMKGREPKAVAKVVFRLIRNPRPPVRKVIGLEYKFLYGLYKMLPARWFVWLVGRFYTSKAVPADAVWSFEKDVLNPEKEENA
ncbi:MAG: SDR family oxidoreductase [Bacillota bacterium]